MSTYDVQNMAGALVAASLIYAVVVIAVYVWYALALSKVFQKLGSEGWKAWVPLLNEAEIMARGGVPGWSIVYFFIPIVQFYGLYLKAKALSRINAQFGYGAGMTVLGIFFPAIWASVLAWGAPRTQAAYDERVAAMMPPAAAAPPAPAASAATGPLAASVAPEMPTFASEPPAVPPMPAADPVAAGEPAAPAVIHNPWAPSSPSDAPTPAVAVPEPIVSSLTVPPPPAPAEPVAVAPVFTPPPLVEPPVVGREVPAVDFPVLPTAPEPVPVTPEPEPAAEPVPVAEPERVPMLEPEPEPAAAPEPAPAPAPAVAEPVVTPPVADVDEDEDEYAATVVVDRRPQVTWSLVLDDGRAFPLTAERVEVGRKPEGAEPGVQYLAIADTTRTLSKTHARLELADGQWSVVDLNSTNGVVTIGAGDVETLLVAGGAALIDDRFILGKVGMRVSFEEARAS